MQFKKQQLDLLKQQTGSKLGLGVCQGCVFLRYLLYFYLDSFIDSVDMNLSKLLETVKGRGAWCADDRWENHSLDGMGLVDKVMSLLFNMLSRLVIAFLPRSKHLLISWLQSPFPLILEPPKIKFDTVSTVCPSICYLLCPSFASGTRCHYLSFLNVEL